MREGDVARALGDGSAAGLTGHAGLLRARRRLEIRGTLDGPRHAAIEAARQQVLGRPRVVDRVPGLAVLEVSGLETDENLVAPRPDAMIGGPAAVPAGDLVDIDVLDGCAVRAAVPATGQTRQRQRRQRKE